MRKVLMLNKSELVNIINYAIDAAINAGENNHNKDLVILLQKLNSIDILGDIDTKTPPIDFEIDNTK